MKKKDFRPRDEDKRGENHLLDGRAGTYWVIHGFTLSETLTTTDNFDNKNNNNNILSINP